MLHLVTLSQAIWFNSM